MFLAFTATRGKDSGGREKGERRRGEIADTNEVELKGQSVCKQFKPYDPLAYVTNDHTIVRVEYFSYIFLFPLFYNHFLDSHAHEKVHAKAAKKGRQSLAVK